VEEEDIQEIGVIIGPVDKMDITGVVVVEVLFISVLLLSTIGVF
jgi:hypothetical protein